MSHQKKRSLTDKAYDGIRARLIAGTLPTDAFIDINELINEFGVSRTPVREALLRLQVEQLIEIIPKKGIRVKTLAATELEEIYEIISGLELIAVSKLAMSRPTASSLAPLFDALTAMRAAVKNEDSDVWGAADECFHRDLLRLSGNQQLAELGCFYRDKAQRAHFVALRFLTNDDKSASIAAHRTLVQALLNKDEAAACATHLKQRSRGARLLVDVLKNHRLTAL